MSVKNLVEMIRHNGLLASMPQLEELYQVAIENELKLAESQREFRAADATIKNLEARCAAMAAESQSVKAMNDCLSEELRGYESDGAFEGPKMHLLWWQCETPNHDAYLAEVRAQGVEMLTADRRSEWMDSYIDDANEFAAQLRKGVQS